MDAWVQTYSQHLRPFNVAIPDVTATTCHGQLFPPCLHLKVLWPVGTFLRGTKAQSREEPRRIVQGGGNNLYGTTMPHHHIMDIKRFYTKDALKPTSQRYLDCTVGPSPQVQTRVSLGFRVCNKPRFVGVGLETVSKFEEPESLRNFPQLFKVKP